MSPWLVGLCLLGALCARGPLYGCSDRRQGVQDSRREPCSGPNHDSRVGGIGQPVACMALDLGLPGENNGRGRLVADARASRFCGLATAIGAVQGYDVSQTRNDHPNRSHGEKRTRLAAAPDWRHWSTFGRNHRHSRVGEVMLTIGALRIVGATMTAAILRGAGSR